MRRGAYLLLSLTFSCRQHEEGQCTRGGYCNFMHLMTPSQPVFYRCFPKGRYCVFPFLSSQLGLHALRASARQGSSRGWPSQPAAGARDSLRRGSKQSKSKSKSKPQLQSQSKLQPQSQLQPTRSGPQSQRSGPQSQPKPPRSRSKPRSKPRSQRATPSR